jgi:beta-glucosidase
VGIAPNFLPSYPADENSPSDRRAARIYDGYFNRWFLDPLVGRGYPEDMLEIYGDLVPPVRDAEMEAIAEPVDFIGVNYYNSNWYVADPDDAPLGVRKQQPDGLSQTADRDVYPQGLYDTLTRLSRDYGFANIYVTENGAAFPDELVQEAEGPRVHDSGRVRFLSDHFEQADRAVRDGVPLRGYFVWSLMDNFEWASGYTLRYGICYTDFETQERIMKDSAYWYQAYIRAHKSAVSDST